MAETTSKRIHRRPNGQQNRPGGLLESAYVENRATPVLREDIFEEPIWVSGAIKLAGDYVRFFDEADSMLHTISAVYNVSPTTRSIIRQKTTLVIGDGLLLMKGRPNSLFPALAKAAESVEDPALIENIDEKLSNVNGDGETLIEVAEKVMQEFLTYGNAYVSFARKGGEMFCHHIPFVKGRVSERKGNGQEEEPPHIGINNDWKTREWTAANVIKIPIYPEWSKPDKDGIQRTIIHLIDHAPGFEYYGLPEWIAALIHAENEYLAGKHNNSKFQNAMVPSGVLQFFGATSQDEAKQIVRDAKAKYTGVGKNGGLFIQVLRDEKLQAKFTQMEDKSEGAFLELSRVSAQAVVSAHRWTMSLAGFATSGKLGSNEQIRREFEIAQNTVIRPLQNMICRRFLNVYMKELAVIDKTLKGMFLDVSNSTPVSFIGDIDLNSVLTTDEKREIAGFGPKPEEKQDQPEQEQSKENGSDTDTDINPAERSS